jgi:hypothetical protein|tara:strand:+ start:95 stop:367 length:273 start_codon:yes stop_codon:yes gene_type:complete
MKNQFFYTRTEGEKSFKDSLNINKVVRTVTLEDGRTLVLLDDLHERSQDVPDVDLKTNKMKGMKRQRDTFQSEIYLNAEDAARFEQLTSL